MSGRAGLRRLWLKLHRWLALSLGWVLAIVALLGAVLVVARPLDEWIHHRLFEADPALAAPIATASPAPARTAPVDPGSPTDASLDAALRQVRASVGPRSNLTFRPPRSPGETLWVFVRGDWNGTVYLHPQSLREQGRRAEDEGLVGWLFKLHSSLMLGNTGKAALAWLALAYLGMLLTGLVLWWPARWPPSWRIERRRGATRFLFDLHRVAGAALGLLIAVSVATGAYMAYRPIGGWISAALGATPSRPPPLPPQPLAGTQAHPPTLDQLVDRARERYPGQQVGYVQVPSQAGRPVRIRMKLADDPHPNGLTSVWVDPRDGSVLATQRWNELDPGARAVSVIYPLHTGELGGPALQAVVMLNGLALGCLGISGLWLWWRRRQRRMPPGTAATVSGSVH